MMTKLKFLVPLMALALMTSACQQSDTGGNKQLIGGIGGAGLGGLLGSQFGKGSGKLAMTGAGVLLGALAGSEVGRSLDKADRVYADETTNKALESAPTNTQQTWRNPDSGNYGTITPTRTYQASSGTYCREYTQTIYVGGQQQTGVGQACRNPDGSWQPVS